jgi:hypothetical protein
LLSSPGTTSPEEMNVSVRQDNIKWLDLMPWRDLISLPNEAPESHKILLKLHRFPSQRGKTFSQEGKSKPDLVLLGTTVWSSVL